MLIVIFLQSTGNQIKMLFCLRLCAYDNPALGYLGCDGMQGFVTDVTTDADIAMPG